MRVSASGVSQRWSVIEAYVRSAQQTSVSLSLRNWACGIRDVIVFGLISSIASGESFFARLFRTLVEMAAHMRGLDAANRLQFSVLSSVYSDTFEVHERMKFPGLGPSSELMRKLVQCGMKYKLRNEPKR